MTLKLVRQEKTVKMPNKRVPPRRKSNREVRSREYLTVDEVKRIRDAARRVGRNGFRDSLLITVAFRHGLRVTEVVNLKWDEVHFDDGTIHITRIKNGREA